MTNKNMIERRPSRMQQVKEIVKALGLLTQLAFDPRTDPKWDSLMQRRRARFAEKNLFIKLTGGKNG